RGFRDGYARSVVLAEPGRRHRGDGGDAPAFPRASRSGHRTDALHHRPTGRPVHLAAQAQCLPRRKLVGRDQGVLLSRHAGGRYWRTTGGPASGGKRAARRVRCRGDPDGHRNAAAAGSLSGIQYLLPRGDQPDDCGCSGAGAVVHAKTVSRERSGQREDVMSRLRYLTLGTREIGPSRPCFVIAEAGINHNGDTVLAAELVDAAAGAGADAIKFQTHFPEHEMLRGGTTAAYVGESLFDLLTRTALSREAHATLRDLAASKGIAFLSTPFSREAADFLETLGVPA